MGTQPLLRALVLFIVTLVVLIFVMAPLQAAFGIFGLVLTELGLFAIAFAFAYFYKLGFKEVFIVRPVKLRLLLGTLIAYMSCALASTAASMVVMMLFPESFMETTSGLGGFLSSAEVWAAIAAVVFLPAVCEEALFRGALWQMLKPWGAKPIMHIALVGFLFGVFHLSPIRFLPTFIVGSYLAWLRYKTSSMLYPSLLHALNNSISLFAALMPAGAESQEAGQASSGLSLAVIAIALSIAFFFLSNAVVGDKDSEANIN